MHLRQIIREQIEALILERGTQKSIPAQKLASLATKYNFYPTTELTDSNQQFLILYYKEPKDGDFNANVRRDYDKLEKMAEMGGWVINSSGDHYSGMRDYYKRFNNAEMGVGTIFVNLEPEYSQKMDDYFGTKENELDNNDDYDLEKHLGVGYQRGIFYHLTERKNLKSIMAHGLRPQNGGGITAWRHTTPRLYLSLLPDFSDIAYLDNDEEYEDEQVILKIDLRSVMKSFTFYVDNKYENAVYTYANIPPKFIKVMNNENIRDLHSKYYLKDLIKYQLDRIVNANWGNYDEKDKKSAVKTNSFEIQLRLRRMVTNLAANYGINDSDLRYLDTEIKQCISNYCNN